LSEGEPDDTVPEPAPAVVQTDFSAREVAGKRRLGQRMLIAIGALFLRLTQEFITPYTPEQNGMIERFFRSLKEECVWLEISESFEHANRAISAWIDWYNTGRPHQSLGYLTPREFRAEQGRLVA
jgi:transposase InsO family protein